MIMTNQLCDPYLFSMDTTKGQTGSFSDSESDGGDLFDKQLALWFNILEGERKNSHYFSNSDKMEQYNRLFYAHSTYNNSRIFCTMHKTPSLDLYVSTKLHARYPVGNCSYFNVHYDSELRDYVIERIGHVLEERNICLKRFFNTVNGYELPISGYSGSFLWKRQIIYNKMRNNFRMRRKIYPKLFGNKLGNLLSKAVTYAEVFIRTKLIHVPWYEKVSWKRSINFVFNFSAK